MSNRSTNIIKECGNEFSIKSMKYSASFQLLSYKDNKENYFNDDYKIVGLADVSVSLYEHDCYHEFCLCVDKFTKCKIYIAKSNKPFDFIIIRKGNIFEKIGSFKIEIGDIIEKNIIHSLG